MNSKERSVKCCTIDLQEALSELNETEQAMAAVLKEAQAKLDKKMAFARGEINRAKAHVERSRAYLEEAKTELEDGFERT